MGGFVVNFHCQTENHSQAEAALTRLGAERFVVQPAEQGWISVFEEEASTQDEERIKTLAYELSSDLAAPCIAFLIHDSDFFQYWLYEKGTLIDRFNSSPDYFGETGEPRGGDADVLVRFSPPKTTREEIQAVLDSSPVFAEEMVSAFAQVLGIEEERALSDFWDVHQASDPKEESPTPLKGMDPPEGMDEWPSDSPPTPGTTSSVWEKLASKISSWEKKHGTTNESSSSPSLSQQMVTAAAEGNIVQLEKLLAEGADINASASFFQAMGISTTMQNHSSVVSPIAAALLRGKQAAACYLFTKGASLELPGNPSGTVLHLCVSMGFVDTLRFLLERGATSDARNAKGQTPRELAQELVANRERMEKLLSSVQGAENLLPKVQQELPEKWRRCLELLSQSWRR